MSLKNYHLRQQEICRSLAALAQHDGNSRARYLKLAERHRHRATTMAIFPEPFCPSSIARKAGPEGIASTGR